MLAHPEQRLSTTPFRAEEQFSVWQGMVSAAFVPVTLRRAMETPGFASRYAGRRIGDLALSWLSSAAQTVERTEELAARRPGGVFFVNLPVAGRGEVVQDGRRATAGVGDIVLVDGDRPFLLDFAGPFRQLNLVIPHEVLGPLLAEPAHATAVTISGRSGPGAVAVSAIRALAVQGPMPGRQAAAVVHHIVGLLALSVSAALPTGDHASRTGLYQAALDEIERSLPDPELSIGIVAARISISPSYLTKLFAQQGTTFGRHLLHRRLDRARAALDPDTPGTRKVTGVALACGFRDSSHFARAFRARFGRTPTQHLAGVGGPVTGGH